MFRRIITVTLAALAFTAGFTAQGGAVTAPANPSMISWNGQPLCAGVTYAGPGAPVVLMQCDPSNPREQWAVGNLGIQNHPIRLKGTDLYLAIPQGAAVLQEDSGPSWGYVFHTLVYGGAFLTHCPGQRQLQLYAAGGQAPASCRTFYVFTRVLP